MKVTFNNYSMLARVKQDRQYYDWCIYVDSPVNVVNAIRRVEYTLHPTFIDPVRVIDKKSSRFALLSSAWGTFNIDIRITLEDGGEQETSHYLTLEEDSWPKGPRLPESTVSNTGRVYGTLFNSNVRYRQFSTIVGESGVDETNVVAILDDLQRGRYIRKAMYQSLKNENLYGATARIGVVPELE